MCTRSRLGKFTHRLHGGDYGYCAHRLRKASRRMDEAVIAAGFALQTFANGVDNTDYPLLKEILNFTNELVARDEATFAGLTSLAVRCGATDQAIRVIDSAPEDQLLSLVKTAVTEGTDELAEYTIDHYLGVQRPTGLAYTFDKALSLKAFLNREIGSGTALASAKEHLEDKITNELAVDAFNDFLSLFDGDTPTEFELADGCSVTCEFGGLRFATTAEFKDWLTTMYEDRGPFEIEKTDAGSLLKDGTVLPLADSWVDARVAVVRDANRHDALFVVLIGNDLTDGKVRRVWLSTNNRIWKVDFEAPLFEEKPTMTEAEAPSKAGNIRPDDPNRSTRANELAVKIRAWTTDRSDKCFRQAIWAIAVDAMFGKTVFVPSEFSPDGSAKATGPVGPDGQRIYVCFVDCPSDSQMYTELRLSAFLATALGDEQTIGVTFKSKDGKVLVRRDALDELAQKVGPDLTGGKESDDAKEA